MVLAYHYLIGRAWERKQYANCRVSEPVGEEARHTGIWCKTESAR